MDTHALARSEECTLMLEDQRRQNVLASLRCHEWAGNAPPRATLLRRTPWGGGRRCRKAMTRGRRACAGERKTIISRRRCCD